MVGGEVLGKQLLDNQQTLPHFPPFHFLIKKSMTLNDQIVRTLRGASYPMSDREIADTISRPLPSVRRARLNLEQTNTVVVVEDSPLRSRLTYTHVMGR